MMLSAGKFPGNSPESRDIAFHMHPYTNPAMLAETGPHIMAEGSGVFVQDEGGTRFYEGMSGLWCTSLGFSEPELVNAAIDQFRKLPSITALPARRLVRRSTLPSI